MSSVSIHGGCVGISTVGTSDTKMRYVMGKVRVNIYSDS